MSEEIWKRIPKLSNYEASNLGQIRSMDREPMISPNGFKTVRLKGRILRTYYKRRYLQIKADGKNHRVHHLVAEAFIGERPAGMVMDHIDGNNLNNHLSNLRYVTISMNNRNRPSLGCRQNPCGTWTAQININKKPVRLGTFQTKEEAAAKYFAAKMELLNGLGIDLATALRKHEAKGTK